MDKELENKIDLLEHEVATTITRVVEIEKRVHKLAKLIEKSKLREVALVDS